MKTKARAKSTFRCRACGAAASQWMGRCADCGEWNTLVEQAETVTGSQAWLASSSTVTTLDQVEEVSAERRQSGLGEFDRVLGGGVWPGSMVLLGGAPGIGKSTLMLQAAARLAAKDHRVLYVSGEESPGQVKGRALRLKAHNSHLLFLSDSRLEKILEAVESQAPRLLVVDSIQTVSRETATGAPGSVGQIRECAAELLRLAKSHGITVFALGHVTKEGDLAGPRLLEHMVDTVLYFDAEREDRHRILRAFKNRFGPTDEIGVFEMTSEGLLEVTNPSQLFMGDPARPPSPGTAVLAALEGTRPLLVEVQALVARTAFGFPRRQFSGVDYNRVMLLIAVLDRRAGVKLESQDVFVNVTRGLVVKEPAADLGLAAAIAGAASDRAVPPGTLWLGEVGLTGELRPVSLLESRLKEATQLGFLRAVAPPSSDLIKQQGSGLTLFTAHTLSEALEKGFAGGS